MTTHIQLDYTEAVALRQLMFQMKREADAGNEESAALRQMVKQMQTEADAKHDSAWSRCCSAYLKLLDDRIAEAVRDAR